jgi:glutaminase
MPGTINIPHIFEEIEKEIKLTPSKGEPASYIPELANVNPAKF